MTSFPELALEDLAFPDDQSATAEAEPGGADATPASVVIEPNMRITRGMQKRRSVPICGYIGGSGHGKSLTMVRDTLPTLLSGGKVLGTVTLLDPFTGNPHPNFVQLEHWDQLMTFRDGDLLLDEVTGIMDSRDQGMPKHVRRHLPQMRRSRVKVRWSGIDFDNLERRLRQLTQAVVRCRGHMPIRQGAGEVALWAPNRAFVLTTFDAQTIKTAEESTMFTEEASKKRKAKVLHREIYMGSNPFTGKKHLALSAYDTMAPVSWVDNSCPICKLKITERYCKGHDDFGAPLTPRRGRAGT